MLRPANRRNATNRFLVERFTQWIPGWGARQLSLMDFYSVCEQLGIEAVEYTLDGADGYALWAGGSPYIYISNRLPGPEKVIAGFHEIAHILYHPNDPKPLKFFNYGKADRQAAIVGAVAWMPGRLAWGQTVEGLMEEFGVSREVASFRFGLKLWPTQVAA